MNPTTQYGSMTVQSRTVEHKCPSCSWGTMDVFYEVRQIPVHSVLLLPTREEAVSYPKGDIELGFCTHCGFISNLAFDPSKHEYSEKYEETQGFSSTFNTFHKALAQRLIDQYDLRGKDIIEIGCGKGEFLTMLCELGDNRGVGFEAFEVLFQPFFLFIRKRSDPRPLFRDRERVENDEMPSFVTERSISFSIAHTFSEHLFSPLGMIF